MATGLKQLRTRAAGALMELEEATGLETGTVEAPFGTMTARVKRRRLPGGQGNDRKKT